MGWLESAKSVFADGGSLGCFPRIGRKLPKNTYTATEGVHHRRPRRGGGGGRGRAGGAAPRGQRDNRLLLGGEAHRPGLLRQGVPRHDAERPAGGGEAAREAVQARVQRRLPQAAVRRVQAQARQLRPSARLHHQRRPPVTHLRVRHHGHAPRRPPRRPVGSAGAGGSPGAELGAPGAHRAGRGAGARHETVHPPVTHKDVRSTNVLLFDGYRAKIADYNMFSQAADMARLNRSTHTLGSFGYQAPEYAMTGQMNDKSDVYSFGIVLLELLTGRKPLDRTLPPGQRSLVNWATPMLTEDRVQECIDPKLGDQYPPTSALKLGRIAVQCLQYDPAFRPSMGTVARVIHYAVVRDQQGVV